MKYISHSNNSELDSRNYLEGKQIPQVIESIVSGLAYSQPSDALQYIEDCVRIIRVQSTHDVAWDLFLQPAARSRKVHDFEAGIVKRINPRRPLPKIQARTGIPFTQPSLSPIEGKQFTVLPPIANVPELISHPNIVFVLGGMILLKKVPGVVRELNAQNWPLNSI